LPSIASADCHCQCTPPISSHSSTRAAQIFSKIPPSTQRWNQSWTVLLGPYRSGSRSHWQPLRIRKRIALSIFLHWATRRPVGFLGQNSLRIGSIRSHNSSGISQIVPSGAGRPLRRGMVRTPRAGFGNSTIRHNPLHASGVPTLLGQFLTQPWHWKPARIRYPELNHLIFWSRLYRLPLSNRFPLGYTAFAVHMKNRHLVDLGLQIPNGIQMLESLPFPVIATLAFRFFGVEVRFLIRLFGGGRTIRNFRRVGGSFGGVLP
jgi:hypothetical protein